MSRATTKPDLIIIANEQFYKLWKLIDSMKKQQNAIFGNKMAMAGKEAHWSRDKNLRDVLIHLYEWYQLLLNWVNVNHRNGEAKPFLPELYNWKTYSAMNVEFWKKHQNTSLPEAKKMLQKSHKNVVALIETFSNDELFAKKSFAWTGTSTLGAYCVSATSSHYDWAIKKMKMHIKYHKELLVNN